LHEIFAAVYLSNKQLKSCELKQEANLGFQVQIKILNTKEGHYNISFG